MKVTLYKKVMDEWPKEPGEYITDKGVLLFDEDIILETASLGWYGYSPEWWLKETTIELPEGQELEFAFATMALSSEREHKYLLEGAEYILDKLKEQIK